MQHKIAQSGLDLPSAVEFNALKAARDGMTQ